MKFFHAVHNSIEFDDDRHTSLHLLRLNRIWNPEEMRLSAIGNDARSEWLMSKSIHCCLFFNETHLSYTIVFALATVNLRKTLTHSDYSFHIIYDGKCEEWSEKHIKYIKAEREWREKTSSLTSRQLNWILWMLIELFRVLILYNNSAHFPCTEKPKQQQSLAIVRLSLSPLHDWNKLKYIY